jgi:hypothetical protein
MRASTAAGSFSGCDVNDAHIRQCRVSSCKTSIGAAESKHLSECISFWSSLPVYKLFEAANILSNDVDAGMPELGTPNIDAESSA